MPSNSIVITVSSAQGSRSFSAPRSLKKIALLVSSSVVLYSLLATLVAGFLAQQYFQQRAIMAENAELKRYKTQMEHELATANQRFELTRINETNRERKVALLSSLPSGFPVDPKKTSVSSDFGNREHPIYGSEKFHEGIDLRLPMQTPVYATANGIVSFAGQKNGYGNVVIIDHAFGFQTTFAHLDSFSVSAGQFINKGVLIAKSGNSGRSTGPHLHYEVRHLGTPLNAANFINWNQQRFDYLFTHEKGVQWEFFVKKII